MKFDIKISEITLEELVAVTNALNGQGVNVTSVSADTEEEEIIITEPSVDTINFDKNGMPWDARIHSSNHQLTAKGVWQRRRGVTDEYVAEVEKELMGQPETPVVELPVEPVKPFEVAPQTVEAPVVVPQPIPAPAYDFVAPQAIAQQPVAPVAPVAPQAVEVPTMSTAELYQTMFAKLQAGLQAKKLNGNVMQNMIADINAAFGKSYSGIMEMKDDDQAMTFIIDALNAQGI